MEQPFIYKYQPLLLTDFDKEEELLTLIKTMKEMDSLNILFIGEVGCGKTTLINAIIREYYGSATYTENNILTINTLKDQGILYYRNEVKTFCQTKSSMMGKKKFIILDNIDHINEQSQQIFRNYIDNYSYNVHFIASCINSQKVIDSIQSRLSILKIKPLENEHMSKIIKKICVQENMRLTDEIQKFIISISNKSLKLVINYLEKIKLMDVPITLDLVKSICTNISFSDFQDYIHYCKNEKNLKASIAILYKLFDTGYSVIDILDTFFLFIKITDLLSEEEKYTIFPIICKYITLFHNVHEDEIELAFFTNNLIRIFT